MIATGIFGWADKRLPLARGRGVCGTVARIGTAATPQPHPKLNSMYVCLYFHGYMHTDLHKFSACTEIIFKLQNKKKLNLEHGLITDASVLGIWKWNMAATPFAIAKQNRNIGEGSRKKQEEAKNSKQNRKQRKRTS